MRKILQNAVFSPHDQKWYVSTSTHEYVTIPNGTPCGEAIDGGTAYLRRVYGEGGMKSEDWSLYTDSPRDEIKSKMLWGTYGKNGDQPLTWLPMVTLTTEHLQNILDTQKHINVFVLDLITEILKEREL